MLALAHARRPALPVLAVVAIAMFTVGVVAQGRVVLHDCVSPGARFGSLGLNLAVLQDAADCPDGTYGLGGVSRGAVLLLSVALPVLVGYVLLTACGVGLSALLVRTARQARTLLRSVFPHLRLDATQAPVEPVSLVADGRPSVPRPRVLVGSVALRGPPVTA